MTRKSTIFISSTCYDLKSVRNKLKNMIEEEMGMEAKLSEHSNFPVDSSIGTVENCLNVVEKNADIFVLIIGSRYGYITEKGKSVTNLEYLRAKEMNIPIYVFIDSQTLKNYSDWKVNNDLSFSHIDSNKIFEFIQKVRDEDNTWTHEYELESQILEMLKLQINYLFTDSLIAKNQMNISNFSNKVLKTSPQALRIVLEQPIAWEHKFFFQVLKDEVNKHDEIKKDFEYEIIVEQGKVIENVTELSSLAFLQIKRFEVLVGALSNLVNKALEQAFGEPGEPADLDFLVYVAERFSIIYLQILKWKLELKNVYSPEWGKRLLDTFHVVSDRAIDDIDPYIEKCIEALNNLPSEIPEGKTIELDLKLELKEFDISHLVSEIENITRGLLEGSIS